MAYHSIRIDPSRCDGKMACMRACPTEAIRVREGKVIMLEEKCIDCGECLNVCSKKAIVPATDSMPSLSGFKYKVALPSPALYGQFERNILPDRILTGLKRIGFDDVWDLAYTCEAVGMAIEIFVAQHQGPFPLISSFCPTVVQLIRVKHPELIELLLPLSSPMEVAARAIKERKAKELGLAPEAIGVIYITPCPVKMVAIREPRKEKSSLNGALAVSDIYSALLSAMVQIEKEGSEEKLQRSCGLGLGWARLGGVNRILKEENCLVVAGLPDVVRIFEDIERGRLRHTKFIEAHACTEGCIGGSLNVENVYLARNKVMMLSETFGFASAQERAEVEELFHKGHFALEQKVLPAPLPPLDRDLAKAIEKMRRCEKLGQSLPGIDCGCCGAPSCATFAEDVVLGRAEVEECVFYAYEKLREMTREMAQFVDRATITRRKEKG